MAMAMEMAGGSSSTTSCSPSSSPCAACKLLRRRCSRDCVFAPYFPADEPHKFACVHKVFGASNVNKMLQELAEHQRGDAVSAMVYEAYARVRDPVYGCAGAISSLQQQVDILQSQLAVAHAQVAQLRLAANCNSPSSNSKSRSTTTSNMYTYDHHRHFVETTGTDGQEDDNNAGAGNDSLWSY